MQFEAVDRILIEYKKKYLHAAVTLYQLHPFIASPMRAHTQTHSFCLIFYAELKMESEKNQLAADQPVKLQKRQKDVFLEREKN